MVDKSIYKDMRHNRTSPKHIICDIDLINFVNPDKNANIMLKSLLNPGPGTRVDL